MGNLVLCLLSQNSTHMTKVFNFFDILQSINISKLMISSKTKLTSKSTQDKIINIHNDQKILGYDSSEMYQIKTYKLEN